MTKLTSIGLTKVRHDDFHVRQRCLVIRRKLVDIFAGIRTCSLLPTIDINSSHSRAVNKPSPQASHSSSTQPLSAPTATFFKTDIMKINALIVIASAASVLAAPVADAKPAEAVAARDDYGSYGEFSSPQLMRSPKLVYKTNDSTLQANTVRNEPHWRY